ncbi:MAG: hypothetical protein KC729_19775, partial [Candidatus Eisenbacteria bacterium]|nr:hypothetical protein [Candidatus Eisenbacteria bacterium]
SRAYFFRPTYSEPQPLMSVDSKLDSGHSVEYEIQTEVPARWLYRWLTTSPDGGPRLTAHVRYYRRHTSTPDWHSRRQDLDAALLGLGLRWAL